MSGAVGTTRRTRSLIRVFSRAGVWGFLVALLPPLAEALGSPFGPSLVGPISSLGLQVSGAGTIVASVLVWRSLPPTLSVLKVAATLGVPFGLALVLGGVALLRPLSPLADSVNAAGPLVFTLAATVVTLLVVGFLSGRSKN